jgi:alkyl hydroperoxide reductase subunit AhpC
MTPKDTKRTTTRITFSVTPEMALAVEEYQRRYNARSPSEAVRMMVSFALSQPHDRALMMAYQQVRADLWSVARKSFQAAFDTITNTVIDQVERRGR